MKIKYIHHSFRSSTLQIILAAQDIAEEFRRDGYKLTLRQLYYQFVSRDLIPNQQREYKRLVKAITDARNAGLFDWDMIEDRTRGIRQNPHWDSVSQAIGDIARQFHYDLWADQKVRVQVWIEKDALVGVFEPVCRKLDVPLMACRGYPSASEVWSSGRLFRRHGVNDSQKTVVLHFGDHDPSGIDMTRDLEERLGLYAGPGRVSIKRIALNYNQIEDYDPPPNPAKATDSRFTKYAAEYGESSWELDALSPAVLSKLATREILKLTDKRQWKVSVRRQDEARGRLSEIAAEESTTE